MKALPDEQTMLEILELAKDFENSARELSEQSMAIALKYEKKVRESQETQSQQATV
ncbi:hypothetical protein PMG71_16870 [Roseofilum sp. BLCC_M154]|uniref:Uncharacterized protein n=1 Tax=Roseofilum acuticapitatum BLCC-M154 TaxID=3022444 RepID=A0ABT7AW15_9CYAN|nr:hypothetical protein [Roseofilum acuticapitatum]MDJ1171104.1 hypothetical protein [Roseofilum acuticapitatum BLCC-M154]